MLRKTFYFLQLDQIGLTYLSADTSQAHGEEETFCLSHWLGTTIP